jgi:hypothetical protein
MLTRPLGEGSKFDLDWIQKTQRPRATLILFLAPYFEIALQPFRDALVKSIPAIEAVGCSWSECYREYV